MREKPTVAMVVVPVECPENYGVVELEEGLKVKSIIEKPFRKDAPTNLANAGIYIFSTEIFDKIKETSSSIRGELEVTSAISLLINEKKQVLAVKSSKKDWVDVGRPWDLLEANRWSLLKIKKKITGRIEDGANLINSVLVADTAQIRSGVYIQGPVFIDEGSDIGPNCYVRPYTSIGKNVRVGNACEIKNSIIMDNTHIGHLSYVGDSIIGENCNLGAGTITANYRLDGGTVKMVTKNGVLDTERRKLGTVLGDNVKSGINALFMPGVKVGENSLIGPNVVIYRDVPSDTEVILKQTLEEKKVKT
jgi:bifunctional UDP-N-acetylglucosamine pyrophosphorylase/glucosamine-1-phosphate N-acetyltransferase